MLILFSLKASALTNLLIQKLQCGIIQGGCIWSCFAVTFFSEKYLVLFTGCFDSQSNTNAFCFPGLGEDRRRAPREDTWYRLRQHSISEELIQSSSIVHFPISLVSRVEFTLQQAPRQFPVSVVLQMSALFPLLFCSTIGGSLDVAGCWWCNACLGGLNRTSAASTIIVRRHCSDSA